MTRGDQLTSWAGRAAPVALRLHELAALDASAAPDVLSQLAARVARGVLADPGQPIGDVTVAFERLPAVTAPAARLAVLDILNALACAGAPVQPEGPSA